MAGSLLALFKRSAAAAAASTTVEVAGMSEASSFADEEEVAVAVGQNVLDDHPRETNGLAARHDEVDTSLAVSSTHRVASGYECGCDEERVSRGDASVATASSVEERQRVLESAQSSCLTGGTPKTQVVVVHAEDSLLSTSWTSAKEDTCQKHKVEHLHGRDGGEGGGILQSLASALDRLESPLSIESAKCSLHLTSRNSTGGGGGGGDVGRGDSIAAGAGEGVMKRVRTIESFFLPPAVSKVGTSSLAVSTRVDSKGDFFVENKENISPLELAVAAAMGGHDLPEEVAAVVNGKGKSSSTSSSALPKGRSFGGIRQ